MQEISYRMAMFLFTHDETIYMLHDNGTTIKVDLNSELDAHYRNNGIFGVLR